MKKRASILGIFTLAALFIFVSCGQRSGADVSEDLAEIRENTREVIFKIDEALAMTEVSDFRSEVQDALDEIDNQIDDYHNTMDNANMRIDREARDAVINLKQQRAAIEFKLDLLENGDRRSTNWRTDPGTPRTDDRTRTDRTTTEDQTGTDWTDDQTGRQQTQDPRGTDWTQDETRTDERIRTDRDTRTTMDRDRDVDYAPELMDELREDLRVLQNDIEEFINRAL